MMGFMIGVIVGAALGIVVMGILHDMDYQYPDEEDQGEDEEV